MAFQEVRDALVYVFADGFLNDEEFIILNELYQYVNPMYPYWEFQPFSLQNLDTSKCVAEFRVKKEDTSIVVEALQLPEQFEWFGGSLFINEETSISLSV